MTRRKKPRRASLPLWAENYAKPRVLEYHQYSLWHLRLIDAGFTTIDLWTTGRYYIKETSYSLQTDRQIIERGGETGWLPREDELEEWLDEIIYKAYIEEM